MATNSRMEYAGFTQTAPGAIAALSALSKAVSDSGLDKALGSSRSGRRRSTAAPSAFSTISTPRAISTTPRQNSASSPCGAKPMSSPRERAALAWTEALTRVTPNGITDESYQDASKQFAANELAFLTAAIASINAWNRIAMAYRFTPPLPQDATQV